MPVSKNQQERLHRINERLNRWGGKPVALAELAQWLDVSERTIKEDIRYLREMFDAPIGHDRRQGGYYYEQPFDLATPVTLTERDVSALRAAVATLNQFRELAVFADFRGAVEKIEQAVQFRFSKPTDSQAFIAFESVAPGQGSELIDPLLTACMNGQPVRFWHRKYSEEQSQQRTIYPYLVKEHRNRWYVVGFDDYRQEIRVFGLDRIDSATVELLAGDHLLAAQAPAFDAPAYFRRALGVAVYDQPPEVVELLFFSPENSHFKSQPFFPFSPGDVLRDAANELHIRLDIIVNDELVYELARLGPKVKVITPASLQQKLVAYLKAASAQYT